MAGSGTTWDTTAGLGQLPACRPRWCHGRRSPSFRKSPPDQSLTAPCQFRSSNETLIRTRVATAQPILCGVPSTIRSAPRSRCPRRLSELVDPPRDRPARQPFGLCLHPPAATHASHSANVTSNLPSYFLLALQVQVPTRGVVAVPCIRPGPGREPLHVSKPVVPTRLRVVLNET
jgi:hypothetical protein